MADAAAAALDGIHTRPRRGPALSDLTLAVQAGEILALLGPAGAGKTAVLRLLAGFARPRSGRVMVRGVDVTRLPPGRSGAMLVETGLGLFADMTVRQALAFVDPTGECAAAALQMAALQDQTALRPAALTPGQRARLAVARALAAAPRVLLLDDVARGLEPAEREDLFAVLRRARESDLAMTYATRDPDQALALGDRVAVLSEGIVLQTGVPQAVYDLPADAAVAALTGPVNTLPGTVTELDEEGAHIRLDSGEAVEAGFGAAAPGGLVAGMRCVVCIRPERLAMSVLTAEQLGIAALAAVVVSVNQHGAYGVVRVRVGDVAVTVIRPAGAIPPGLLAGRRISLAWQAHHAVAYPMIAPQAVAAAVQPR